MNKRHVCLTLYCGLMIALTARADQPAVLVEAEAFKNPGGWVNDSQFMDQMGSSFLLTHGLGRPVEDAETTVQIPSPGKYRAWARTRDWMAQWTKGRVDAPGKFQVLVNDKPLETPWSRRMSETARAAWGISTSRADHFRVRIPAGTSKMPRDCRRLSNLRNTLARTWGQFLPHHRCIFRNHKGLLEAE